MTFEHLDLFRVFHLSYINVKIICLNQKIADRRLTSTYVEVFRGGDACAEGESYDMIPGRLEDYTICDSYRQANPETAISVTKVCNDFDQIFETQYSEDGYCAGHIIREAAMTEAAREARCNPGMPEVDADATCDSLRLGADGVGLIGGSAECLSLYQSVFHRVDPAGATFAETLAQAMCHSTCREYIELEITKGCLSPTVGGNQTWLAEISIDFPGLNPQTLGDVCAYIGADSAAGRLESDGIAYDSSTICARREECELLCEDDSNCAGIMMHEYLPRCYLTSAVVDGECQATSPANIYDFLHKTSGPVKYGTDSNVRCADTTSGMDTRIPISQIPIHMQAGVTCTGSGESDIDKSLCATRAQCEAACSATADCMAISSWNIWWGPRTGPRCTLHSECSDHVPVSVLDEGRPDSDLHKDASQIATKQAFLGGPQCYPTITTNLHETYDIADFTFTYDQYEVSSSSTYFTAADTTTKVLMEKLGDGACHMSLLDGDEVIFKSEYPDLDCQTGLSFDDWAFSAEGFQWQVCPRVLDMRFNRQCLQASACDTLTKCFLKQADWDKEVSTIKGLGLSLDDPYDKLTPHLCAERLNRPEFSTFMLMSTQRSIGMYHRAQQSVDWFSSHSLWLDRAETNQIFVQYEPSSDTHFGLFHVTESTLNTTTYVETSSTGFSDFVTEIIHIESYTAECGSLGASAGFIRVLLPFAATADVTPVAFASGESTPILLTRVSYDDEGWFSFAAAADTKYRIKLDVDECTISAPCGTNEICSNIVGAYTCTCPPGYAYDNLDECIENIAGWVASTQRIRVENAAEVTNGLRLRTVTPFSTPDCSGASHSALEMSCASNSGSTCSPLIGQMGRYGSKLALRLSDFDAPALAPELFAGRSNFSEQVSGFFCFQAYDGSLPTDVVLNSSSQAVYPRASCPSVLSYPDVAACSAAHSAWWRSNDPAYAHADWNTNSIDEGLCSMECHAHVPPASCEGSENWPAHVLALAKAVDACLPPRANPMGMIPTEDSKDETHSLSQGSFGTAICLTKPQCESLCKRTSLCAGVLASDTLPRCHLLTELGAEQFRASSESSQSCQYSNAGQNASSILNLVPTTLDLYYNASENYDLRGGEFCYKKLATIDSSVSTTALLANRRTHEVNPSPTPTDALWCLSHNVFNDRSCAPHLADAVASVDQTTAMGLDSTGTLYWQLLDYAIADKFLCHSTCMAKAQTSYEKGCRAPWGASLSQYFEASFSSGSLEEVCSTWGTGQAALLDAYDEEERRHVISSSGHWAPHGAINVHDYFGTVPTGLSYDDPSGVTEWITNCLHCDVGEAWLQHDVPRSGPFGLHLPIQSLLIVQDPRHTADLTVTLGPADDTVLPAAIGVRTRIHAAYTNTWSVSGDSASTCVRMDCGQEHRTLSMSDGSPAAVLLSDESVLSPCDCKELCLRTLDSGYGGGCVAWTFYLEDDQQHDEGGVFAVPDFHELLSEIGSYNSHMHRRCILYKNDHETSSAPVMSAPLDYAHEQLFVSDWAPIAVTSLTSSQRLESGTPVTTVTLTGVRLQEVAGAARLKLVEGVDCTAPVHVNVNGLDCTSNNICSPAADEAGPNTLTWRNIFILPMELEAAESLGACVCTSPPCATAGDWALLPRRVPTPVSSLRWRHADDAGEDHADELSLDEDSTGSFVLRVDRPHNNIVYNDDAAGSLAVSLSDPASWDFKIVKATDPAGLHCVNGSAGAFTTALVAADDQVLVTVTIGNPDYGSYVLCINADTVAAPAVWTPIGGYINVERSSSPFTGFYRMDTVHAMSGVAFRMRLRGRGIVADTFDIFTGTNADCSAGTAAVDIRETHPTEVLIETTLTADSFVCANHGGSTSQVGTVVIQSRIAAPVLFAVNASQSSSIEISNAKVYDATSPDLNPRTARAMLIECLGTCGYTSGAVLTPLVQERDEPAINIVVDGSYKVLEASTNSFYLDTVVVAGKTWTMHSGTWTANVLIYDRDIDFYYMENGVTKVSRGLIRIDAGYNDNGHISIIRNLVPGGARPSYIPLSSLDANVPAEGSDLVYLEMYLDSGTSWPRNTLFAPWLEASYRWTRVEDSASSYNTVDVSEHERQCYTYCHIETATTTLAPRTSNVNTTKAHCWDGATGELTGYQPEYDVDQYTEWLCMDREMCRKVCEELDSCGGFTMHHSRPRCKLHRKYTSAFLASTEASASHDLWIRRSRDLDFAETSLSHGVLLSDRGYSTESLLRFQVSNNFNKIDNISHHFFILDFCSNQQ